MALARDLPKFEEIWHLTKPSKNYLRMVQEMEEARAWVRELISSMEQN